MPGRFSKFLVIAASATGALLAHQNDPPEYGPSNGTLIIVGGGNLTGTGIMETFINRTGGPSARIIAFPTAGGNQDASGKWIVYKEEQTIAPWVKLGAINEPAEANYVGALDV